MAFTSNKHRFKSSSPLYCRNKQRERWRRRPHLASGNQTNLPKPSKLTATLPRLATNPHLPFAPHQEQTVTMTHQHVFEHMSARDPFPNYGSANSSQPTSSRHLTARKTTNSVSARGTNLVSYYSLERRSHEPQRSQPRQPTAVPRRGNHFSAKHMRPCTSITHSLMFLAPQQMLLYFVAHTQPPLFSPNAPPQRR